jgi:hypothetical protein
MEVMIPCDVDYFVNARDHDAAKTFAGEAKVHQIFSPKMSALKNVQDGLSLRFRIDAMI